MACYHFLPSWVKWYAISIGFFTLMEVNGGDRQSLISKFKSHSRDDLTSCFKDKINMFPLHFPVCNVDLPVQLQSSSCFSSNIEQEKIWLQKHSKNGCTFFFFFFPGYLFAALLMKGHSYAWDLNKQCGANVVTLNTWAAPRFKSCLSQSSWFRCLRNCCALTSCSRLVSIMVEDF